MKKQRRKKSYLLFITPGFLAYTVFIILPIIYVIYLSVFEWSGLGEMNFIGIEKLQNLVHQYKNCPCIF